MQLMDLPVIKDPELIKEILYKLKEKNSILYFIANYMLFSGTSLTETLMITFSEASGNSFYNKRLGRIMLYSYSFTEELNNFLSAHTQKEPDSCIFKSCSRPMVSRSFIRFFSDHGYKGSAKTFHRSFLYLYVQNKGAFDTPPWKKTVWIRDWIEHNVGISKEEYKMLQQNYENKNLEVLLLPLIRSFCKEADLYLMDKHSPIPAEKIRNLYSALYDLVNNMDITRP